MKFLLMIVAARLLAGEALADDAPVSPKTWGSYRGTTLTVAIQKPADFVVTTSGRAMFGLVGASATTSGEYKLADEDGLVDPALAIAANLSLDLAGRIKPANVTSLTDQDSSSEDALARAAGGKGLVLDVETTRWGYTYSSLDGGRYRTTYGARVQLLDAATGKFIAKSGCNIDTGTMTSSRTGEDLLANHSEKLKATLVADSHDCLASVEKDIFGATEPAVAKTN